MDKRSMSKKNRYKIILFVVIIAQAVMISIFFANYKHGFHSDEPWSYGFANSYYEPYIYATGNFDPSAPNKLNHFGEWFSGKDFYDYLTVNKGESFQYDSIVYNTRYDQSPPLYPIILHTISSVFVGKFSWWYAFVINLCFFLISQVILYKLTCLMIRKCKFIQRYQTDSLIYIIALIVCILYGFSLAALNSVIFLRMYAMLTSFTLMFTYISYYSLDRAAKYNIRDGILLFFTVLLAGTTHYSFFIYAFLISLFTIIGLIIQKNWKRIFVYGFSIICGGICTIIVCPGLLENIFSDSALLQSQSIRFPYWYCLEVLLDYFAKDTLGLPWIIDRFLIMDVIAGCFICFSFLMLLFFLFRKDKWFQTIKNKLEDWFSKFIKNIKNDYLFLFKKINWEWASLFCATMLTICIIAKTAKIIEMGEFVDRYVFFVMPYFDLIVVIGFIYLIYILTNIFRGWTQKKLIIHLMIVLVAVLLLLIRQDLKKSAYLFESNHLEDEIALSANSDCVIMTHKEWALEWYSALMLYANRVYAISTSGLEMQLDELRHRNLDESNHDVFLFAEQICFTRGLNDEILYDSGIETSTFRDGISESEFIEYIKAKCDWIDDVEYMYTKETFRGNIDIFKVIIK